MNTEALIRSSRRTVLVVEDEEINREILGKTTASSLRKTARLLWMFCIATRASP